MTREEIIDGLEIYTVGRLNKARVHITVEELQKFIDAIKALEQESKTGHWIVVVDKWSDILTTVNGYRCSECNAFNTDKDIYCPNCGTKMQAESEVGHGKNGT